MAAASVCGATSRDALEPGHGPQALEDLARLLQKCLGFGGPLLGDEPLTVVEERDSQPERVLGLTEEALGCLELGLDPVRITAVRGKPCGRAGLLGSERPRRALP